MRSYAQKQTVTLSHKNAALETVMIDIRNQTGYNFLYDYELLKYSKPVTIQVKDVSILTALDSCFSNQPFTYAITGSIITFISRTFIDKIPSAPKQFQGRVTNMEGFPLEGAYVTVKGTPIVTTTDLTGGFQFLDIEKNAVLEISHVTYATQLVKANRNPILIKLEINPRSLDAVVATSYSTTTRRNSLATSDKITAEEINKAPVNNPLALFAGRVPGVTAVQQSGLPGSGFTIQIRGQRSIGKKSGALSANSPLFVIDGVPFLTSSESLMQKSLISANSPFSTINPEDIESIEILKDANSTSIYGSLGANGVVLITTKRPKAGKTNVDVKMSTGWGKVTRKLDYMNTEQYLAMRREALANDGKTPDPNMDRDLLAWDQKKYINWPEELIGGTSTMSNAHIRLSGGTDNTQFTSSIGYNKETTIFPGNYGKSLISLNLQLYHTSENKKLEIVFANSYGYDKSKLTVTDITSALDFAAPNLPETKNQRGALLFRDHGYFFLNPYAGLAKPLNFTMNRLTSSIKINYKIFPWLQFRSNIGFNSIIGDEYFAEPRASLDSVTAPTAIASWGQGRSKNWLVEPQLEFNKEIKGKHRIKSVIGTSLRSQTNSSYLNVGKGYLNDNLLGSIDNAPIKESSDENKRYRLQSVYGLINYNFDGRYIVEGTGRRDGSSRFGPDRQFGNFYSVSAGWIFSNEKFIKKALPFLDYGKLRASYGTTGNDQIGDYEFLDQWTNTTYPYLPAYTGYYPFKLYNNDFRWEIHKSLDISLDLAFLNERLFFSAVYNQTTTNNQLIQYPLPSQTGFNFVLRNSSASVGNKNFEMELSSINVSKDHFKWNTSVNLTISKNTLLSFPDLNSSTYKNYLVVGQPLDIYMGYRTLGVNPQTGVYTILDRNGNVMDLSAGPPTSDSNKVAIDNFAPRVYGGLYNGIQYRNWKLDVLFQFVKQKGKNQNIVRAQYAGVSQANMPVELLDRWQKPGDQATYQRYSQDGTNEAAIAAFLYTTSDALITDASFIRLKTVSLSYSLPYKWIKKLSFKSCDLFVQGQNLLTITKYKGNNDPENGSFNITNLPPLRIINVGIQASF
jgi:TonB-linked SusC/RagA family outer membrane protein